VAVAVIVLVELFDDLRHVVQRLRHTVAWWWEGVERHDSLRSHLTELALLWRQFDQHRPNPPPG
jgi:hypothetical protein